MISRTLDESGLCAWWCHGWGLWTASTMQDEGNMSHRRNNDLEHKSGTLVGLGVHVFAFRIIHM